MCVHTEYSPCMGLQNCVSPPYYCSGVFAPTETDAARTVLHGSVVAGRPKPGQSGPDTSLEGCLGLSGITYALGGAVDDY